MMRCTQKYLLLLLLYFTHHFGFGISQLESSEKQAPSYAKNFEVSHFSTHRIITVHVDQKGGSKIKHRYALVPRDADLPELPEEVTIIRTPIKRVVVLETIHIGYLDALDKLDTIIGAPTLDYVSNSIVRARTKAGIIRQVQVGSSINIEQLLLQQPDLILTSIPASQDTGVSNMLLRSGLPVVFTAEYREYHPLARAEWIKCIAECFDAVEKANEIFKAVAIRYKSLRSKVDNIKQRPTVFCGAPYSGVWHVARGESYIAQAIHDAGGSYLWDHMPGNDAIPMDTERVFLKAARADIWINPSFYRSCAELYGADPRFKKFQAAQAGKIYNHTRQQTIHTGNPIWETGVVHPDKVLADLIKIFHPDLMTDWGFVYYEQLQ